MTAADGDTAQALPALVARRFAEALGHPDVAPDDDFFGLGGHDLLFTRLVSRLSREVGCDLPPAEFLASPTAAGVARLLAVYLDRGRSAAVEVAHRPDLAAEARLPAELTPAGLPVAAIDRPRRILLTGATGFLGSFLLDELLRTTDATVHCLVRAPDAGTARARIGRALTDRGLAEPPSPNRVVAELGDLGQPWLGLPEHRFAALAGMIDTIYHAGATVNFVYPYHALKRANVDATRDVLWLACHTRAKAVHYVSTLDARLRTEGEVRAPGDVTGGYLQSKWVAEQMVAAARDRGLPVRIYRPGVTLGHTVTGVAHETDFTIVLVKGCLQLGLAPDHDTVVSFQPVDYVAPAIVRLSLREAPFGQIYHLANQRPATLVDVWRWVREYGYPLRVVPLPAWRQQLREVGPDNALFPVAATLAAASGPELDPSAPAAPAGTTATATAIPTTATDAGLAGTGIECPPVSRELIWRTLDFLVGRGFLPPPGRTTSSR